MIENTLVLVKPDGVSRGLIGEVIKRFEQRGLKIAALKLVKAKKELAEKHYTDDIAKRRGEWVRNSLLDFITEGPIVAMVVRGINSVENVRKIVGPTESKSALPGTIRGDFSHVSYGYADETKKAIRNIIHASGTIEEAIQEIAVWFKKDEIHDYKRSGDEHIF